MYIYIYRVISWLYRDNGEENGNYCLTFRVQGYGIPGLRLRNLE